MAPPNESNNTAKAQIDQADLDKEMWQEDHPMATRSKTGVPPSTPQRYTGGAFHGAPFLAHTAPSGSSSSPEKSGRIKDKSTPKSTVDLWKKYISQAIHEPCVVPLELKPELETEYNTPIKSKGPVANNVYAIGLYAKDDLLLVLDTVKTVVEDLYEHRGRCHEPH
ncbi:MAG: hypothetical protein Q9172_006288 [Xanthocarpia lactea]